MNPLFGPDSMMWRINRERIVLLGGPAAAVLQAAHPQVAMGVARHSRFREDAAGRLTRTLDAVYAVAFGEPSEVEGVRERVGAAHRAVRGKTPAPYSAYDPRAQLWVLATLAMGSVGIYRRFVGPLEEEELDRYVREEARFGEVFGLDPGRVPATWKALEEYWDEMMGSGILGSHPLCGEVVRAVLRPERPAAFRLLSPLWTALTQEWLDAATMERLGVAPSRCHGAVWGALDLCLPPLLPRLPRRWRYAPAYAQAVRRLEAASGG